MNTPCKHYWMLVGARRKDGVNHGGRRWYSSHALIKCRHCGAWSVAEYGKGPGPCGHVVGTVGLPEGAPVEVPVKYEEILEVRDVVDQ